MGIARRMKRKDVIPKATQAKIYMQGAKNCAANMVEGTREQLSVAYNRGMTEGKVRTQMTAAILSVAVLHDRFGFGKKRAQEFADALSELTGAINSNEVALDEVVEALADEGLDFLLQGEVEDGAGQKWIYDWTKKIQERRAVG